MKSKIGLLIIGIIVVGVIGYSISKFQTSVEKENPIFIQVMKEWVDSTTPTFREEFNDEGQILYPINLDKVEGYEAAKEEIKDIINDYERVKIKDEK